MSVASNSEQLLALIEEYDKKKKERGKIKKDFDDKKNTNESKINNLYTNLENVNNELKDQVKKGETFKSEADQTK